MAERITAWRCIGCGKIEAPQPCIGVCQDRKVDLVDARDYDEATAKGAAARCLAEELTGLLRRLAFTTPRTGEWERSYRALQAQARTLLDSVGSNRH
jgi:hypothetical protein